MTSFSSRLFLRSLLHPDWFLMPEAPASRNSSVRIHEPSTSDETCQHQAHGAGLESFHSGSLVFHCKRCTWDSQAHFIAAFPVSTSANENASDTFRMLFAGDLNVGVNKVSHSCTARVSLDLK